jgi:hypothetical protein
MSIHQRKNPASARGGTRDFFFVDKRFEISNLDLVRDMAVIIELEEVLFDLRY